MLFCKDGLKKKKKGKIMKRFGYFTYTKYPKVYNPFFGPSIKHPASFRACALVQLNKNFQNNNRNMQKLLFVSCIQSVTNNSKSKLLAFGTLCFYILKNSGYMIIPRRSMMTTEIMTNMIICY